jgi:hypothetical protein
MDDSAIVPLVLQGSLMRSLYCVFLAGNVEECDHLT